MSKDQRASADEDLIERIAAGDRSAFELLFRTHGERIFRYVYRLISDAGKAEEVTNDVMLEVWRTAARFERRSKASTWILGIARHRALNAVRRKVVDTIESENAPEPADEQPGQALEHDRDLLKDRVRHALGQLSPDHRDVIELTFFQGLSYPEIAAIVGCPENTVKTRMFHARKQMKRLLGRMGLDPGSVEMAS